VNITASAAPTQSGGGGGSLDLTLLSLLGALSGVWALRRRGYPAGVLFN